jgi:fatty acid synthase subunit beta
LYKDRLLFKEVRVSGDIFTRDYLNNLTKVGYVDFQEDDCKGNPVVAYLQRHGVQQDDPTPLPNDGYTLSNTTFSVPLTNEPYSKISGDFNPIHVNPYFSCYASLPATITHGMWSSAATRRFVENIVAKDHPERVLS